ncbi:AAA family ATPase [Agromyces terreus]|uniref:AAA family ATPase n=1 Tax=Agromyces terreus TaxID=424795 RepID=UPI0031D2234C
MELHDSMRTIRRNWVVIVAILIAAVAAGFVYSASVKPQYQTAGQLLFTPTAEATSTQAVVQANAVAVQMTALYAQVAVTPLVLQPAIDDLALDETPSDLAERVAAGITAESPVMFVSATADSPQEAVELVDAVMKSLLATIEDPEKGLQSAVPLKPTVLQEPPLVDLPATGAPVVNILLALAAGLAIAFIVVVLRESLNGRIRGARDLRRATDASLLAAVPRDRAVRARPLLFSAKPLTAFAESFRLLRQRIPAASEGLAPVVVVSSPEYGDGKSTVAANLALSLAEAGRRVTLVDANLRAPVLAKAFDVDAAGGLAELLAGEAAAGAGTAVAPNLTLVPTSALDGDFSELLESDGLAAFLDRVRRASDAVVIDAGPLLPVADGAALAAHADAYLVVVRAGRSKISDLRQSVEALTSLGAPIAGVVLDAAPTRGADAIE